MGRTADIEKVRVNVYLPKQLVDRLDEESAQWGVSRGAMISLNLSKYYQAIDDNQRFGKMTDFVVGNPAFVSAALGIQNKPAEE